MKDTCIRFQTPLRIALLADLHDRPFDRIVQSLRLHQPEIICIAGDVMHRIRPDGSSPVILRTARVLPFLRACAGTAPTFLSLGNHEWPLSADDLRIIAETGVTVLDNRWCRFQNVTIGGLSSAGVTAYRAFRQSSPAHCTAWAHGDDPEYTEPETAWLHAFCRQPGFKLLLSHHPEYRDRYLRHLPIDLVLSGHAHGGQIRLLGRGLYAYGQGFLPKYTDGIHGNMIVSRGLSNTAGFIPRLLNPTEIVYILPEAARSEHPSV